MAHAGKDLELGMGHGISASPACIFDGKEIHVVANRTCAICPCRIDLWDCRTGSREDIDS